MGWRHFAKLRQHPPQRHRRPHNFFIGGRPADLFSQRKVFFPQLLFFSLAIMNISTSCTPANEVATIVEQRVIPDQEPSVPAVFPPDPYFVLPRGSTREAVSPRFA